MIYREEDSGYVVTQDGKLVDVSLGKGEVLRVELTSTEFEEFVESKGIASRVSKREDNSPIGESGNYVVYNDLCIQTQGSYE